jgi:hypothetical protein
MLPRASLHDSKRRMSLPTQSWKEIVASISIGGFVFHVYLCNIDDGQFALRV